MRCWVHAQIVCPLVSVEDRARLEAIIGDRNRAQKHVARARIILGSAARLSVAEVARRARVGRPAVWRWQRRFVEAGVDGLLRDATRKPGKAPLGDATVHRVVGLTCSEPPGEATHWTGRAMAKTAAISLRSVQRIWRAMAYSRTASAASSAPTTPSSRPNSRTSSAVRRPAVASLVLSIDEKSQFRPSISPSPVCRSSRKRAP